MKTRRLIILEVILGILGGLLGIIYSGQNLFIYLSGLAFLFGVTLFTWIVTILINILLLSLSILIIYHSVRVYKTQLIKHTRYLIVIAIIFLGFSLFRAVYIILYEGYRLFSLIFLDGLLWSGVLSLIAGLIGLKNSKKEDKKHKKKFILTVGILSALILLGLIGCTIFAISEIASKGLPTEQSISNLEGKLVFQQSYTYDGRIKICLSYLKNPENINCFADGRNPRWSPDGNKIAYWYWDEGHTKIAIFDTRNNQTQSLNYLYDVDQPIWSPNGDRIAFTKFSEVIEEGDDLYLSDLETANQYPLTNLEIHNVTRGEYGDIDWSKKNNEILFTNWFQMNLINLETKKITKIETNLTVREKPRISPDGKKIVFSSEGKIYTINIDSSGLTQLTYEEWADRMPAWSPDGTKIIFYGKRTNNEVITSERNYGGWFVINSDGTNQTLIIPEKNMYNLESPDWHE